jgi:hypothetical protein
MTLMVVVCVDTSEIELFRRDTVAGGFRYVRFLRKFDATQKKAASF